MRGLCGQDVELLGRGEALLDPLSHLPFSKHMHRFDAHQGLLRRIEGFEPQHGSDDPLNTTMILLDNVVEILYLAYCD